VIESLPAEVKGDSTAMKKLAKFIASYEALQKSTAHAHSFSVYGKLEFRMWIEINGRQENWSTYLDHSMVYKDGPIIFSKVDTSWTHRSVTAVCDDRGHWSFLQAIDVHRD
jgi:hypothetical protein